MQSPIPWMGSKRRLADQILRRFPDHHCYVELFAGSGALLFAREEPANVEVLNDVDGEIVNFFRVLKHHLVEVCRELRFSVPSRRIFEWLKATPPETLTDIQRAARFYYLQRTCFGGRSVNRSFGYSTTNAPKLNLVRLEEDFSEIHGRLHRVLVEELPWQSCLRRYDRPTTLFFADPPYFGLTGYGQPWTLEHYAELATALGAIAGKALITINDCPEMRGVFEGFAFDRLQIRYMVGRAVETRRPRGELLYRSWKDGGGRK